jgi:hypothetical protein
MELDFQGHDIRAFPLAGGSGLDADDVALWYSGLDVCDFIGLKNSRDAIPRVPRETRMRVRFEDGAPRAGNAREMWFIDGDGFRWLIRERPTMHHDVHGWLMFNQMSVDGIKESGNNKLFTIDECKNDVYTLKEVCNDNMYYQIPFDDDKAFYADIDKNSTMDNDDTINTSINSSRNSINSNSINNSSVSSSISVISSNNTSISNTLVIPIHVAYEIQRFIDDQLVFRKGYRLLYKEIYSRFRRWWMDNAPEKMLYKVPNMSHIGYMLQKTFKYYKSNSTIYLDVDLVK